MHVRIQCWARDKPAGDIQGQSSKKLLLGIIPTAIRYDSDARSLRCLDSGAFILCAVKHMVDPIQSPLNGIYTAGHRAEYGVVAITPDHPVQYLQVPPPTDPPALLNAEKTNSGSCPGSPPQPLQSLPACPFYNLHTRQHHVGLELMGRL